MKESPLAEVRRGAGSEPRLLSAGEPEADSVVSPEALPEALPAALPAALPEALPAV